MRRLRVLGGLAFGHHAVAPAMYIGDRGKQQPKCILGPADIKEIDKAQDIAAIGALGVGAGAARDPAFEQLGDAGIEAFGAFAHLRGLMAGENRRQLVGGVQDGQVPIFSRGPDISVLMRPCI
jgi:hypothetical protein